MNQFEALHALLVQIIMANRDCKPIDMQKAAENAAKAFHAGNAAFDTAIQDSEARRKVPLAE